MLSVALATLPAALVLSYFFGWGTLINVVLSISFCLSLECFALYLRKRPILFYLKDNSALVTAVLIALSVPPYAPWWLLAIGCLFAIVIAKHLYGGLGYNPFNPAMVAYVVLIISFPLPMSQWPVAQSLQDANAQLPNFLDSLSLVFASRENIDAYTAATPLDVFKQNSSAMVEELYKNSATFSQAKFAGVAWEWVNLAFLAGGLFLLYKKVFTWHAPLSMLAALALMSALFYDGGSSSSGGSPLFHCFSGASMFGAFFIITDPVSSATSRRGKIIFGASIGLLVFVIRLWGNYPDALAFSVLLLNFAAPFIDYYTQPRAYGHSKKPPINSENTK